MNGLSGGLRRRFRLGMAAMACGFLPGLLVTMALAQAQETPVAEPTPVAAEAAPASAAEQEGQAAGPAAPETPPDAAAAAYAMKCMGCHTIGGGVLTGPDLKNSAAYPRQTVVDAVNRMVKNVGPLSSGEVETFADFLLSPDAAARLEEHRKLVRMRETAALDPPNAELGRMLFLGSTHLANGGAACAACHQAGGRGGNLAASLEDAFSRLGDQPLLATTETPGFPVMRAMYTPRPVTKQEAIHIVKYLEEVSKNPAPPASVPLHLAGLSGAVAALLLLGKYSAKRVAGTRARMVAEAYRRRDLGGNRRRKH
ncbi:MAG: hypothetical protein HYV27_07825 [Candidatus Hydrogenedentes bacterium]|nr:hypothetical protein [Candidatus Hydrogenedentota bacterium]